MLTTRLAKIAMCLALALFCLLVAYDNVADARWNYEFVQHVMSMDTTFPDNTVMYRAVTDPQAWQIVFALITATETICGVLFIGGALQMWQARYASAAEFQHAKVLATGSTLAFLLWFFVFMVIAGEWFAMWQSKTWNAQSVAFRIYVTVLAVLIFVNMPDGELDKDAKP